MPRPARRPLPLFPLAALALSACAGGSGVEYDLSLVPLTPSNQRPFEGLDRLQLTLEPARGTPETFELGATSGSPQVSGLSALDETRVAVEGFVGETLVTFGRTRPITLSDGPSARKVLVSEVETFGWFTLLEESLTMGAIAPDGDGRFFLFGGSSGLASRGDESVDDILMLDVGEPSRGLEFRNTGTPMPDWEAQIEPGTRSGRMGHTATLLGGDGPSAGKILVAGGCDQYIELQTTTWDAFLFDPETEEITTLGEMRGARSNHIAVRNDAGDVVLIGGWGAADAGYLDGRPNAEYFDRRSNRFESISGTLPGLGVFGAAANTGPAGILFCGGIDVNGSDWEAFDGCRLISNAFEMSTVAPLPVPLAHHAMASAGPGKVLVTGGLSVTASDGVAQRDVVDASDEAYLYDVASNSWSAVGPMTTPRAFHQAVPLSGGRVLLVGGSTSGGLYWSLDDDGATGGIGCAEIFDPSGPSFSPVGNCDPSSLIATAAVWPMVASDPVYGTMVVGGSAADTDGLNGVSHWVSAPEGR